ncbi:MAG TPA: DUF2585 family protein [Pyrinomonadaceae bacterium]|nr:DUF2585 family protein [Pyrinomonadaceae bacterium]
MTAQNTARRKLLPIVGIIVVLLLMGAALSAEGRMLLCACGEFKFWVGDTCSSSNSQQLFDPYSFTHVLHGFLLFWFVALLFRNLAPSWQFLLAFALEAAWEVFENTKFVIERYRAGTAALGYEGDTIVNSFGDLACAALGFLVARKFGLRWSLVVFLLFELILVLWIRDSLLLQLLMLIRPVETIKLWQMCR